MLRELVVGYAGVIHAAVTRVVGRDHRDVERDVIQQLAESLWKRLDDAHPIAHPAAYVYRCAIRETIALLNARHPTVELEPNVLIATSPSPEEGARAAELSCVVDQILDTMQPERAEAVRAHLIGFTVEEIMQMHAWPYQKARNLIARGLAELREHLRSGGLA